MLTNCSYLHMQVKEEVAAGNIGAVGGPFELNLRDLEKLREYAHSVRLNPSTTALSPDNSFVSRSNACRCSVLKGNARDLQTHLRIFDALQVGAALRKQCRTCTDVTNAPVVITGQRAEKRFSFARSNRLPPSSCKAVCSPCVRCYGSRPVSMRVAHR